MTHQEKITVAQSFLEAIPYSRALSMKIIAVGDGRVTIEMPYSEELIGDPISRVIDGGAVSALMDTCAGTAVISHPKVTSPTATLSLNIEYMRPAVPNESLIAHAECYHVTRTVAFVRVTAFDNSENRPVATASGTFTVSNE